MRVRIAIAVSDDAIQRVGEVASACDRVGFRVNSMVPQIGLITGLIEEDRLEALRAVPGVAAVELAWSRRMNDQPAASRRKDNGK